MSADRGSRVVTHVVVIILAATLPAAMFGEPGDGYFEFLKEFQTLLTGLLAVGAAAYTISEMIKSDAKQEQRHREMVEISMLPSKLAVARVAEYLPKSLRHYCEQFRLFSELLDKDTLQPAWDKESVRQVIRACMSAHNLRKDLLSERVTSCHYLFDHDVMQNLEELRGWSGSLLARLPDDFAMPILAEEEVPARPAWYNRGLYAYLEVMSHSAGVLADEIDEWAEQFHLPPRKAPDRSGWMIPMDAVFPKKPTDG